MTDTGYAWLLLVELINDRSDPEAVMRHLMHFSDARDRNRGWYPDPSVAQDALFCYAIANGLDIPRIDYYREVWNRAMVSEALLPYPEDLSEPVMMVLFGYLPDGRGPRATELFNASLRAVDDRLRESTGKGVLESHSDGSRSAVIDLYQRSGLYLFYLYDPRIALTYISSDGSLGVFLEGMYRYCMKLVAKDAGGRAPSVPNSFTKEFRLIVDKVHADGYPAPGRPRTPRGTMRGPPEEVVTPVVIPLPSDARYSHSTTFRKDMEHYASVVSAGARAYVPSGCSSPDYRKMDPAALEYYLYWRDQTLEGRYGATDEGYLRLRLCELVNSGSDLQQVLRQLAGLSRAYEALIQRDYCRRLSPGTVYVDYALVKCGLVPDPTVFICNQSCCSLVKMLLDGGDPPVCPEDIFPLAGIWNSNASERNMRAAFTDDCARIAARVIARVNRISIDAGGQVWGFCGLKDVKGTRNVFEGLVYYGGPTRIEYVLPDPYGNDRFREGTRDLVKSVIRAVQSRGKRPKPVWIYGVEVSRIIFEETERWFSEKSAGSAAEEARSMVIDMSEVDRASEDLDHVTRLMGTDETHDDIAEEPPCAVASGDPWADLASRLNKGQREYLRKALEGTLRAAKPTTEGAINAIAMDAVKDAVIEDGRVFEDYIVDLERIMGMSDR